MQPTLTIDNVRRFAATNSSSSHYFLFLRRNNPQQAIDTEKVTDGRDVSGQFGWDDFTVIDPLEKQTYLAICLLNTLNEHFPEEVARLIARELAGVLPDDDSYVDHQSRLDFPMNYHYPMLPDFEFYGAFLKWALQPDIAILGGNDNTNEKHELRDGTEFTAPIADIGNNGLVVRHDPVYDSWTLFNRRTGMKIRMRFGTHVPDDSGRKETIREMGWQVDEDYELSQGFMRPARAYAPELLDIKITDWCGFGCPFCTTPETLITTSNGDMLIKDILVGDQVVTANPETGNKQIEIVSQIFSRYYEGRIINIELENGQIVHLTPDHKVYTKNRGWIFAGDLVTTDELMTTEEFTSS